MERDLSVLGRALAAPARSAMLNSLIGAATRPASELAAYARVSPATASEHLAVLVDAGLITCQAHGRHRYYRLANAQVAAALEQLGKLCPETVPNGYHRGREAADLAAARLCYGHLAGQLGLGVAVMMRRSAWLDEEFRLTGRGERRLIGLGIDVTGLRAARRTLTKPCLDWTERRHHLGGSVGAAIADLVLAREWARRRPGSRGLDVTADGAAEFAKLGVVTA